MKSIENRCLTCKYRKRGPLKEPCNAGTYQMHYGGRCNEYKPSIGKKITTFLANSRAGTQEKR